MTSKSIELAIFWLPLIAGVLLGGIAGSAWYGGDKIPAIWIGFFGIVCLLLTGAFQIQQFAYANLLQPEIELSVPDPRSILIWDPPKTFYFTTAPSAGPASTAGESKSPVILLQNKSSIFGQDATATWEILRVDNKALIAGSSRFSNWEAQLEGDRLTVGPKLPLTVPTGLPHRLDPAFKQNVPLPFLARETETFIPYNVWTEAILIVLATLPDQPGQSAAPVAIYATLKWNIPEGKKVAKFKILATATNATLPNSSTLTASIDLKS